MGRLRLGGAAHTVDLTGRDNEMELGLEFRNVEIGPWSEGYGARGGRSRIVAIRAWGAKTPSSPGAPGVTAAAVAGHRKPLSLVRDDGSSHVHGAIRYRCHMHRATTEVPAAGTRIDSYAEETGRYRNLNGALACLIEDCAVQGVSAKPDGRDVFDGP